MNLNVNFNILKQFNCALVGRIKYLIVPVRVGGCECMASVDTW